MGLLRIVAGDRADTTVTVTPGNPDVARDVAAAERTRVEMGVNGLMVETPHTWRYYAPFGGTESVDVLIEVPSGSVVNGSADASSLHARGTLGDVRFLTGAGDIELDAAADVWLRTGSGSISVGHVAGDLTATSSAGPILAARTEGSVTARTSFGPITLGEVAGGTIKARTSSGSIEIAVRDGVPAELDLTATGPVHNHLGLRNHPDPDGRRVDVRATTGFGAITIRRASEVTADVAPTTNS
jgi:hypothetical protein